MSGEKKAGLLRSSSSREQNHWRCTLPSRRNHSAHPPEDSSTSCEQSGTTSKRAFHAEGPEAPQPREAQYPERVEPRLLAHVRAGAPRAGDERHLDHPRRDGDEVRGEEAPGVADGHAPRVQDLRTAGRAGRQG